MAAIPTSLIDVANSPEFLEQIREARQAFAQEASKNPEVLKRFAEAPMDVFLEYAPKGMLLYFTAEVRKRANAAILSDPIYMQKISQASSQRLGQLDSWGSIFCEIGLWAALVAVIAGAIAISQGALIAPLIALDAGLLTVLAAITGLSEGLISVLAAGAGFTFGMLIHKVCSGDLS